MFSPKCFLLFGLLLTLFLDPISGRKGFGSHSNPKSGGGSHLSGGGHHSGGLSGGGLGYPSSGNQGYPSGGLSGGGHSNPSSGGNHGNPSSGGTHSYPSTGGTHGYPSSGTNQRYPSSGNSHGYPSSGGLSGNSPSYPSGNKGHTTNIHNHYHYTPPQQISYAPVRGAPPVSYPVYRGQPPTYVYQYKDSGSKYGTLLAGLALLNLGTLAGAAYAHSNSHGSGHSNSYKTQPGEVCKFAVKRDNGYYEETKIDCQIISSFILQDQASTPHNTGTNSTVTSITTVTNVTTMNTSNGVPVQTSTAAPTVLYAMLPNGTLVPVNATGTPVNATANETVATSPNGTVTSSVTVTTTTTNTTLVNALDVKGKPVEVTPGMQCFVIRSTPSSTMRKAVPCGLLQTYADKSIRRNSATRHTPVFTIVAAFVAYCLAY